MSKKLYLIDAANYLFRSYFAIRRMSNSRNEPTNALFGFIRSVQKLLKQYDPEYVVCVFDAPDNKASRTKIYKEYKGNRGGMPDDLLPQLQAASSFCEVFGITQITHPGVEADDVMGTLAKWAETENAHTYLCSSDKDLCQLVSKKTVVLNQFKNNLIIDPPGVQGLYGITPEQMVDYLAICGDSSDNIPGVKSFGPKTAQKLLEQFGTLDNMLQHTDEIKSERQRETLLREKDKALISQQLATIQTDVSIDPSWEEYILSPPDISGLTAFYEECDFRSLLKDLGTSTPTSTSSSTQPLYKLHILQTADEIQDTVKKLSKEKHIVIDTETTSLDAMSCQIVGLGLTTDSKTVYYIPFNKDLSTEEIFSHLKPLFTSTKIGWIGHNLKYDMHVLYNYGITLPHVAFDTMIASYLLNAHSNRHSLDALCKERYDVTLTTLTELTGKKKKGTSGAQDVPIDKLAAYCGDDVYYTHCLWTDFAENLKHRSLEKLFNTIEMPLIPVLFTMEQNGMFVDVNALQKLAEEFTKKLSVLTKEIYKHAKTEFNINSPSQLSKILFEQLLIPHIGKRKATGYSTGADVLEQLYDQHPIIPLILEYRSLEKLRSTYVEALPKQINPKTHRIHTHFHQSVTTTGRLSSSEPNLQNIPIRSLEGRKIRTAFRPEQKTSLYVSFDYSQIELRILAHLSNDPILIEAFLRDMDIHTITAANVFGVEEKDVTKEMRHKAKAVNFGLIYGQQAFGLSRQLHIPYEEAKAFIDAYFATYPAVALYLNEAQQQAIDTGKAVSLFGRERLLEHIHSKNTILRNSALRFAVNTPIQGTQSDIIKKAMILIDETLKKENFESEMVLQIHDELLFEAPEKEVEKLKKTITPLMENVLSLKVPLKVDICVGRNWGEC